MALTPEEYRDIAVMYLNAGDNPKANSFALIGILEVLLQMEICSHGTRGFCSSCFQLMILKNQPIQVSLLKG
jgi:hypothetical protein